MVTLLLTMLLLQTTPEAPPVLDQNGKSWDLANLGQGLTVVDFAASWCKPCWLALPHLQALANEGKVRVLVLSEDNDRAGRDKLVRKLGLTLPVAWDQDHHWAQVYKPKGMPSTLVLDQSGELLYSHVGFSEADWQEFLTRLDRLLQEHEHKRKE